LADEANSKAGPFSSDGSVATWMGWSDLAKPGSVANAFSAFSMTLLQHAQEGGPA
jgi:hypothetical protein